MIKPSINVRIGHAMEELDYNDAKGIEKKAWENIKPDVPSWMVNRLKEVPRLGEMGAVELICKLGWIAEENDIHLS